MFDGEFGHTTHQTEIPLNDQTILIDRVEASGAQLEQTLERLNISTNSLYFLGAVLAIVGASGNLTKSLWSLNLSALTASIGILGIAFLVALIDFPGHPSWAGPYRYAVFNEFKFITKITTKGVMFIFLSSLLALLLPSGRSSALKFLFGTVLNSMVGAIGLIGCAVGLRKSLVLERVKRQITANFRGSVSDIYKTYAVTDAAHGMNLEEFSRLCSDYTNGTIVYALAEVAYIFNALDLTQKGSINSNEFEQWIGTRICYI